MPTIRWTGHALDSLAVRNIPRAEAERALREPEHVERRAGTRRVLMRRYADTAVGRTMLLRIVVEEREQERVVVTAYKTSRFSKYLPDGLR